MFYLFRTSMGKRTHIKKVVEMSGEGDTLETRMRKRNGVPTG